MNDATHKDHLGHHWKLQSGVWRVYKEGCGWTIDTPPKHLQPIWPESNERIEAIGKNGGTGEHYSSTER